MRLLVSSQYRITKLGHGLFKIEVVVTLTVRQFLIQTLHGLRNTCSYVAEDRVQIEFCASRNWVNMWSTRFIACIQGSSAEIQIPARSVTACPCVLSPSSILPSPFHRLFIPARINSTHITKIQYLGFYAFQIP